MVQVLLIVLHLALLVLGLTGAGLVVAAVHAIFAHGGASSAYAREVRAGSREALRRYTRWWLGCTAAWVTAMLVLRSSFGL